MMQGSISSFNQDTLAAWDGSKYPVAFSGHLGTLNSNSGATILTPGSYQSFLIELNGLKATGVTGVVINIDYPILDPNFDAWGGQSADYLDLYQRAIADIRTRGLKVIIETGGLFSQTLFAGVNVAPYYQSLSTTDYMNGRAQQALVIAQQLQPDYLNVLSEPDTEADQTGKPELYTYAGSMQLLGRILGVLRGANTTIPIGAGVGTWSGTDSQGKGALDYINGYASTTVDSIDMHVYPVNHDYLNRMNAIASAAKAAGKKITISEAWAYKVRDSELGILPIDILYSRDVYSFWAPLDTQFLEAMVNFSHYQHVDYMAAFWTGYFRAYLDWDDTTCCLPPSGLYDRVHALQSQQEVLGGYSGTGYAWEDLLVAPSDTTPPDQTVLTAPNVYPNQTILSWTWPNDNIGVARFTVERDGSLLGTTVNTMYSDKDLSDGKEYKYTVTSYDAKNNKTGSTLSVATPDNTKPTAPTVLIVEGDTNTSIRVTWSGATDNVKVTGYKIFRGVDLGTPIGWAAVGGSPFIDTGLQSNTTYCYYILSQDAILFVSDPSDTKCHKTPDTRAPSVPTNVTATGTAPPQAVINWSPSTDGVAVAGYNIQRKLYGGTYAPLTSVPNPPYIDATAIQQPDTAAPKASVQAPAAGSTVKGTITFSAGASDLGTTTTYYYHVNAFDPDANTSTWSAAGTVSWGTNTSGIAGVRFLVDGIDAATERTVSPYYISWDTSNVSNGSHTLTVVVRDNAGNSTTSAPVVVTVGNFDTTAPSVPKNVSANGATPPQATISWTASTDAKGVTGYNIQRQLNAGAPVTIATGLTSTSFIDTSAALLPDTVAPTTSVQAPVAGSTVKGTVTFSAGATDYGSATTYYYQVDTYDAAGNTSAWSLPGSLAWPKNISGIAGVRFLVDGIDAAPEVTVSPFYVSWDTTRASNGSHTLTVVARDKAGNIATSAPVVVTVGNFDTTAPSVPKNVAATGATPPQATVSWTASTDAKGVTGYNIQRQLNSGAPITIATGLTSTSFIDTSAALLPDTVAPTTSVQAPVAGSTVKGTVTFSAGATDYGSTSTYYYQVDAYDAAGNTSAWSLPGSLAWPKNISGIAGVRFLVDGVDAAPETTVSPYYISWDTTKASNGSHTLTVVARDKAGNITTSTPVVVTVGNFDTTAPTVPASLLGSGTAPQPITLSWGASTDATGVAGYNVQRKLSGGVYSPVASGLTATSFIDSAVALQPDVAVPAGSVAAPTAGTTVRGTITFSASTYDIGTNTTYVYQVNAFDAARNTSGRSTPATVTWGTNTSGIGGVRFLVDGVDAAAEVLVAPYYIRWNTTTVANGSHTLSVITRDNAGNSTTSAPVVITVGN